MHIPSTECHILRNNSDNNAKAFKCGVCKRFADGPEVDTEELHAPQKTLAQLYNQSFKLFEKYKIIVFVKPH